MSLTPVPIVFGNGYFYKTIYVRHLNKEKMCLKILQFADPKRRR